MLSARQDNTLCLLWAFGMTLLHAFAVCRLEADMFAILSLLYVPIRFVAWLSLSIERRLAGVIMQCCGDLGFFGWIAFYPQELTALGFSFSVIGASMLIGAGVLSVHAVFSVFLRGRAISHNASRFFWSKFSKRYLWLTFAGLWGVAFLFSMLSHVTGIAAMGVETKSNAVLPFRLAGVLAFSRIYAVPMFALVFVDVFFERKKSFMLMLTIVLFVGFSVVEAYIRLSRGVIITNMIYLFFWAVYRGKLNFRVLFSAVGVVPIMAVAYPYISRLRGLLSSGNGNIGEALVALIDNQYLFGQMETGFLSSLYALVIRGFSEGVVMCKFIQHLNFDIFIHHLGLLRLYGNTSLYHTRVIDGVDATVAHSSGITLYTDSLFIGGLAFVFVTAALFSWISYLIDARKMGPFSANPALQASVCFFFFTTFAGGIISKVFLREPLVVLVLLCVWTGMYVLSRLLGGVPKGGGAGRIVSM